MSTEQIIVEDRDAVRTITLNRPDKLNAWTPTMSAEMVEAIDDGNRDPAIGAFVFTGAGRAFCAGADIGAVFQQQLDDDGSAADGGSEAPRRDWVGLVRESKPMVAAINGASVGVGLTLTLPMDFLMAAPDAKLSARFVKLGLVPELASSHYLVQRCGWGAASDLALSGRMVSGSEAFDLGLVDAVVAGEELVDAAVERAAMYAANPAPALEMIKRLLSSNGTEPDLREVQRRELEALNEAYTTSEHREAVAAFMEKREPKFR